MDSRSEDLLRAAAKFMSQPGVRQQLAAGARVAEFMNQPGVRQQLAAAARMAELVSVPGVQAQLAEGLRVAQEVGASSWMQEHLRHSFELATAIAGSPSLTSHVEMAVGLLHSQWLSPGGERLVAAATQVLHEVWQGPRANGHEAEAARDFDAASKSASVEADLDQAEETVRVLVEELLEAGTVEPDGEWAIDAVSKVLVFGLLQLPGVLDTISWPVEHLGRLGWAGWTLAFEMDNGSPESKAVLALLVIVTQRAWRKLTNERRARGGHDQD